MMSNVLDDHKQNNRKELQQPQKTTSYDDIISLML